MMNFLKHFSKGELGLGRIEAFSDRAFARRATYGMIWLNSLFLIGQSFIPFPTALMDRCPMNRLAVSLFGVVMA